MTDDDPTQPIEPVSVPEPEPEAVPGPAGEPPAGVAGAEPAAPATAPIHPAVAPPILPAVTGAPSGRRKAMGTAGQVVGVVGIVVCLALVVGVVIGRGWAVDQVEAVAATIDDNLARGEPLIAAAAEKVGDVQARFDVLGEAASALAASDNPAPGLVAALSDRLSGVSERYLALRDGYADVREQIVTAIDRLETLDRLIPGITIPQGPVDALAALDARVQELDAAISPIIGENGMVDSIQGAAGRITERVAQAEALLTQVEAGLEAAEAKLAETRAQVEDTAATLTTVISIGSLVLVVLLLYIALLHWILFRSAAGVRRGPAAG
jgi:hypothetical protein